MILEILILPPTLAVGTAWFLVAVLFHRPVELPGLMVALAVYLAALAFPDALQHIQAAWQAYLCFLLLQTCVVLLVAFPFAYVLRRRSSAALIGASLAVTLLFGLSTGYAQAAADSNQSIGRWSGFDAWWYSLLSFPGGLGDLVTNYLALDGADWQGGELWENRQAVVLWNGVGWVATTVAVGLPIHFITEKYDRDAAFRPRPAASSGGPPPTRRLLL